MKVPVSKLTHHPLNSRIYSLSGIESLMESIKMMGLLEPLTVDQHFQVVSGNRRFESVKRLSWDEIDVHQIHVKEGEEVLTLIHFNRQRIKTTRELLNEFFELETYHKDKGLEKGKKVRNIVSEEIKVTDGQLARILYIHKRNPKYIELIDQGILTVNQAYLNIRREEEEKTSRENLQRTTTFKHPERKNEFTFYQKSSYDLNEIEDESVQCIFTSPPFGLGIRTYSDKVIIGSEKTIEEYTENLSDHLVSCYRVLNERGSFFLNLGDVYHEGEQQNSPHKVLFKLLEKTKFKLRSTIIYKKTNPKPLSYRTRRNTVSTEFIFHLVKDMSYDFEQTLLPLSEKTKPSHPPRHRTKKGDNSVVIGTPYIPSSKGKNLPDYWDDELIVTSVANQSLNYGTDHPAMYHPSLVTIPLLQTCVLPFNSIERCDISHRILDPFAGGLNTYKSMKWINETYGTNLEFVGYDLKKYF